MPERLPLFPELPAQRYTVALDGAQYELRLTYRERTASWYLDLWNADGVALLLGRRLSPNWPTNGGVITNGPPGLIVPFGADPYDRAEIELWYYTLAELDAAEAAQAQTELPVELG